MELTVEKHKVLQILVNLIRNARQACLESGHSGKRLVMRITGERDRVRFALTDNGTGIAAENLTRIFNFGFTTKKDGHGFGLHGRRNGGSLCAQSEGPGKGATFTLELPRVQPARAPEPAPEKIFQQN